MVRDGIVAGIWPRVRRSGACARRQRCQASRDLELRRVQRDLPPGSWLTRLCLRAPFLVGSILVLLPHLAGTVVNISYNALRIVSQLSEAQQNAFLRIVLPPRELSRTIPML